MNYLTTFLTEIPLIGLLLVLPCPAPAQVGYSVDTLAAGIQQPTAMVFLSSDRAVVASRASGQLFSVDLRSGDLALVDGVPENLHAQDAGLHGLALHPEFGTTGQLFLSLSSGTHERSTLTVVRARLAANGLTEIMPIIEADAFSEDLYHYGGALAIRDSFLFITVGDRHHRDRAQDLQNHAGTILRLHLDGRVPEDNPFVGDAERCPEIWSYGHRNPQELLVHPSTGELWAHEHGPRAGDELNRIRADANYGWPVISYGWEYDGGPIGRGIVREEGMEQPAWVWTPAIAPSAMFFYTGSRFPQWEGSLFVGAMAGRHVNRLVIRDGRVVLEERLLLGAVGRVRLVAQGPDGLIYLGTDDGLLLRITPVSPRG